MKRCIVPLSITNALTVRVLAALYGTIPSTKVFLSLQLIGYPFDITASLWVRLFLCSAYTEGVDICVKLNLKG